MDFVHFAKIKLWKDNPRKNDQAVPRLMELLKIHGQKSRIGVSRNDSVIYKGNTTYKALVRLVREWKTYVAGESAELFDQLKKGLVKVEWMDFPSAQAAAAYAISDNLASEFAEWDDDVLNRLMKMPEVAKKSGFTQKELSFMNLAINKATVDKIHSTSSELKERLIMVTCSAAVKVEVREMLIKWITLNKLEDKVVVK